MEAGRQRSTGKDGAGGKERKMGTDVDKLVKVFRTKGVST